MIIPAKKSLIFFGAGASFGCSSLNDTPPLTKNLFNELKTFNSTIWNQIPKELEAFFISDFEKGMSFLFSSKPTLLPILQRSMASYFFKFIPGENNLYRKLAQKIQKNNQQVQIATINYDRLLIESLLDEGITIKIGKEKDNSNRLKLILPHGCCNLFNKNIKGLAKYISIDGLRVKTNVIDSPVIIRDSTDFYTKISTDPFPPIMSYIEPTKNTLSGGNFLTTQREIYKKAVMDSELICIIGVSIRQRDRHIWQPLQKTSAELVYCSGKDGSEFEKWIKSVRKHKKYTILNGFFIDYFDEICKLLEL